MEVSADTILLEASAIVYAQLLGPLGNGASPRVLLAIRPPELSRDLPARNSCSIMSGLAIPGTCLNILSASSPRRSTVCTKPAKFGLQFFDAFAADLFNPLGS